MSRLQSLIRHPLALPLAFVMIASYFTYMHDYTNPPQLFWDENYHIASAQKYLNGVYFMEPHPPLGKLMIAAGEALISPESNGQSDQFIGTDYGKDLPPGFSFAGYRFFPTLLAWLIAPLFFAICYLITRRPLMAMLVSSLYIFDNALIVHSRSAMLESTLLFFGVLTILAFLLLWENPANRRRFTLWSLLFGASFAAVLTTKVNGLILILLIPPLIWRWRGDWQKVLKFIGWQSLAFLIVYGAVWHTHFALGKRVIETLPDQGYYQASVEYKKILRDGTSGSPLNFPLMLGDSLNFLSHYQRGVPKLDMCKTSENGSYFMFWPLGGKAINYRWETPDGSIYRYLYLQSNPVVWGIGLLGVILAISLLVSNLLLPLTEKLRRPELLTVFLGIYLAYMFTMSRIDRVMYLYHYFFPLLISLILFVLCIIEIRRVWRWKIDERNLTAGLLVLTVLVISSFHYFRPLTYNEPITDAAFNRRVWLDVWGLRCVNCEAESPLTEQTCE